MPNHPHESPLTTFGKLPLAMQDAIPDQRLYLGISGGLDSAYLAYRLLSMDHPLLLHHCTYKTGQNRWPHEEMAYRAVLDWLTAHGLTNWQLITTEFARTGSIPYWFLDYEYLFWVAGAQLRNHGKQRSRADIRHVVIPSHAESRRTFGNKTFDRIWETLERTAERSIIGLEPMKRYSRPEILGDMPPDLMALCWWCRTPKDGRPCHECSTCKVVDPALEANGLTLSIGGEVLVQ